MGDGWTVLTFRGVPLRIQPSWLFSLAIFTVLFQGRYAVQMSPEVSVPISWALALATALLLFASVLLHELGHAVMAVREGVKVLSITLFHLGGIARVERDCDTAMGSLRIAAAGPLVSLLLALALLQAAGPSSQISPVLPVLCTQIGLLNLMLGLFNLLPGLPLDGGLILKALVWKFSGSQQRGVQVASASGRALSTLMILLGGMLLLQGGGFNGLMLMLIGWFGLGANRSQSQMLMLQKVLKELRVGEAAGRRFRVLESDQTLRRLSQLRLQSDEHQRGADWVLVCRSGRWLGWVDDRPLRDQPVQHWDDQRIGDHLQPLDSLPSIADKSPLWEAVLALEASEGGRLLVMSPAGLPSGTIDRMDLGEAVLKGLGVRLPEPILEEARKRNSYPLGLVMLPQIVGSMQASSGSSASEASSA
ncbi:MAG: Putative zinc metalloprotease Rip3 [Synechococcus sp. CC9902]|nr:MAG: Putative zinc metalloprotease Rip3 [Synechococcus sp. CC9902]|tara:strand:+ start:2353 stop:3612 length:1260 start_codon:yes stop_codon:yes gene_type:complete